MSEWKECKLGDVSEITSSKRIFYSDYVSEGIPFWRSKEVIEKFNRKVISTDLFITPEKYFEIKNKFGVPQPNDILLTSVGTLGIPYLVEDHDPFYFKDGNLTWIRNIDEEKLHPKYLYKWLASQNGRDSLGEITIGSTQEALTIIGLKNLNLLLPPLEEQKAIAEVLSSLDDKIDLLHRQNKTLEELAQTLFRQWFIEEAKEEWEEIALGEVVETTSGGTPSRSKMEFYEDGTIEWIKSKELSGSFILSTEEKITAQALKSSSAKLLPKHSVLIAMYGATVGEYAMISKEMTCNQAICALKPNEKYPYTFLFMFVKNYKEEIINMAVGSAQQNISQQLIKTLPIPTCFELINNFHKQTESLFEKILSNIKQIQTLENLKDTLLSKLMSGEVRVEI